jgi:hypothetical protein
MYQDLFTGLRMLEAQLVVARAIPGDHSLVGDTFGLLAFHIGERCLERGESGGEGRRI